MLNLTEQSGRSFLDLFSNSARIAESLRMRLGQLLASLSLLLCLFILTGVFARAQAQLPRSEVGAMQIVPLGAGPAFEQIGLAQESRDGLSVAVAQQEAQNSLPEARRASGRFRLEVVPIAGGAELVTIFGDAADATQIPLVSVLRDTFGDADRENDRLRYVWAHTYARPDALQWAAAATPFLYARVGDSSFKQSVPRPILDLADAERDTWERGVWLAFRVLFLDSYGFSARATARTLKRNADDYKQAHRLRALAVLSLYSVQDDERAFSPVELHDIQARLSLTQRMLGGIIDDVNLERAYQKQNTFWRDIRGHNWELLRQRAEAEGLYFDPLKMPDGSETHALLWIAREDLAAERGRKFNARFLNIANPWRDRRLERWRGYSEVWGFTADNQRTTPDDQRAVRRREMIPLALYGLDHPKIPVLLVDFRDRLNPKRREMSRRLLDDVARNLLQVSRFGDLYYFLGRTVFDLVTGRRGIDINQPSRLRAYSQLKLLLTCDQQLAPPLRAEIKERLGSVALNPLENSAGAEARIAQQQYAALLAYARRPDGLPALLEKDRRAELADLQHGRWQRAFFRVANIVSFGLYHHTDGAAAGELQATLDRARRLAYHRRFLREVAASTPRAEIVWRVEDVRRSLRYVAEHGTDADAETARAIARIFAGTSDEATRELSLRCLYRINNATAKSELLKIYRDDQTEARWRALTAQYLITAVRERQSMTPSDARAIMSLVVVPAASQ
ncbi:MAG: hypothetical protein C4334_10450 [Pyrinomonas sp.]